jgi:hypothetical protein
MGSALLQGRDASFNDRLWRIEVRLADAQADYVVHRGCDVEEAPDARGRHAADALATPRLSTCHVILL